MNDKKPGEEPMQEPATDRNGVPLFPVSENAAVVTLELVNQLRDEPE